MSADQRAAAGAVQDALVLAAGNGDRFKNGSRGVEAPAAGARPAVDSSHPHTAQSRRHHHRPRRPRLSPGARARAHRTGGLRSGSSSITTLTGISKMACRCSRPGCARRAPVRGADGRSSVRALDPAPAASCAGQSWRIDPCGRHAVLPRGGSRGSHQGAARRAVRSRHRQDADPARRTRHRCLRLRSLALRGARRIDPRGGHDVERRHPPSRRARRHARDRSCRDPVVRHRHGRGPRGRRVELQSDEQAEVA